MLRTPGGDHVLQILPAAAAGTWPREGVRKSPWRGAPPIRLPGRCQHDLGTPQDSPSSRRSCGTPGSLARKLVGSRTSPPQTAHAACSRGGRTHRSDRRDLRGIQCAVQPGQVGRLLYGCTLGWAVWAKSMVMMLRWKPSGPSGRSCQSRRSPPAGDLGDLNGGDGAGHKAIVQDHADKRGGGRNAATLGTLELGRSCAPLARAHSPAGWRRWSFPSSLREVCHDAQGVSLALRAGLRAELLGAAAAVSIKCRGRTPASTRPP